MRSIRLDEATVRGELAPLGELTATGLFFAADEPSLDEPSFGEPSFGAPAADETATRTAPARPRMVATSIGSAITNPGPSVQEALQAMEVGQRVDDFDLLTQLGSGAFARVFLARQRSLQRLVAVKISADHGNEPQTLAQLDQDYIVRVYDQKRLTRRGLKLLYMQYLPGGTLLGVLRRLVDVPVEERSGQTLLDAVDAAMADRGELRTTDSSVRSEIASLSWPETVAWLGRRLATALDYASARGVLHRDIKPANILLTAEGVPKLADFNISYARNVEGASPVSYFGGSLSYMSPEQLRACHPAQTITAAELDTRSDLYSLGVVLWELLTARKPFGSEGLSMPSGGDLTTLNAMIARRDGGINEQALDQLPPDCPAALRRILIKCMAADRRDRWSSGAVLAQQLDLCLDARARDLVDPPAKSWRLALRRHALPIVIASVLIPNVLASIYNVHHNQTLVISRLSADAQMQFGIIVQTINLTFFPLASALLLYRHRLVFQVPRRLRAGQPVSQADLTEARRLTLRFADHIVEVVFTAWVIAGIVFPVALQLVTGEIPATAYAHFIGSLVVCGAIAVSYPFFLVNFYLVRCVYPEYLPSGGTGPGDVVQLHQLDTRLNWFLSIVAAVPLLGVAGVTFIDPTEIPKVIVAVRVLCLGAVFAFIAAYVLFRLLEEDLQALSRVVADGSLSSPS